MSVHAPDPDAPEDEHDGGASSPPSVAVALVPLLEAAIERRASDLHVTVGAPPSLRIDGDMVALGVPPLTERDAARICRQVLTEQQLERFAASHALRMGFRIKGLGRFRGSFFMQRGTMSGVYRVIPLRVPTLDELGLPHIAPLATVRRGLVLVGGPLGSGKSTTIASLLATIARERRGHLVTIEDPVEHELRHEASSLVSQIDIGSDYPAFAPAFEAAMAQDPDVLMISELTGVGVIEGALQAAETGRLVVAASPSRSIAKAIARIVNAYPPEDQPRARARLADVLEAVTCQSIAPRGGPGDGRQVACEVLRADAGLRARVRDGTALLE